VAPGFNRIPGFPLRGFAVCVSAALILKWYLVCYWLVCLQLGPAWRSVAELCAAGRYQPLLLLYANPNVEPIDVSLAPDGIIRIPQPPPASHGLLVED